MVRRIVVFVLLLWIADVAGTLCVWRGAPYDASADMGLSFWRYELWRLPYWAFCFLTAASIWLLIRLNVQRLAGRNLYETRYTVKKAALQLLGLVLAFGGEVTTSVWYWRQLPWSKTDYGGIPYSPYYPYFSDYLWGHLTGWAIVLAIGLIAFFFWNHKRSATPVLIPQELSRVETECSRNRHRLHCDGPPEQD